MKDENGRKSTESHSAFFCSCITVFTYYLKKIHRKNAYTFLWAWSNFKNDHMKTAAPVLLASDKSKRTKEMPSSTDRTTFLQMEASTLPEDNFR